MRRNRIISGSFVFAAFALAGCQALAASKLPTDVQGEISCVQDAVEGGLTDFLSLAAKCAGNEINIVIDAIDLLLSSSSWKTAHPDLVPKLLKQQKAHPKDSVPVKVVQ